MSLSELLGEEVIDSDGATVKVVDIASKCKVIGLYFSANWCPPSWSFTPVLLEWYNKQKDAGANLEIVFVSFDEDQVSFDCFFGVMPWKAMAYSEDMKAQTELGEKFSIEEIPTMVFLKPDGTLITKEGCDHVENGDCCNIIAK